MPQSQRQIINQLEKQFCHEAGLVTLETRNNDSLDFPEVNVADIRRLIERAFQAGIRYSVSECRIKGP